MLVARRRSGAENFLLLSLLAPYILHLRCCCCTLSKWSVNCYFFLFLHFRWCTLLVCCCSLWKWIRNSYFFSCILDAPRSG
jgi:hypothetical protein